VSCGSSAVRSAPQWFDSPAYDRRHEPSCGSGIRPTIRVLINRMRRTSRRGFQEPVRS
jgi:hypothetical protein